MKNALSLWTAVILAFPITSAAIGTTGDAAARLTDNEFVGQLQDVETRIAALKSVQTDSGSQTGDGWNYRDARRRLNPLNAIFWEFKYFNFHTPDVSGNVTFMAVAPSINPKMIVLAHIYTSTEIQTYRKVFDFSCVRGSKDSARLDLCDDGGIEVLAPDHYKISLRIGTAEWLLDVVGENPEESATTHIKLDGWLPWEMFWRPVFIRAVINGTIRTGSTVIPLLNAPAYHDQNWGRWKPSKHPYHWLHFSGVDSAGEEIDVLLGDFYKNRSEPASELVLRTPRMTRKFGQGEFEFAVQNWGRSETLRFGFEEKDEFVSIQSRDALFQRGDHFVPTRFTITSKDGSFALTADTLLNDAVGSMTPSWLRPFFKDFIIDEQLLSVTFDYRAASGERRSAQGKAEFQSISR